MKASIRSQKRRFSQSKVVKKKSFNIAPDKSLFVLLDLAKSITLSQTH
jgi:hypothetical protein